MCGGSPTADWLLANRGYDPDWFRNGLKDIEIKPCVPSRKSRRTSIPYDGIFPYLKRLTVSYETVRAVSILLKFYGIK